MKKAMKTLPLAIAFALLAAFIPLLSGGGMTARADGDFTIENGVLKKYNGSGGYVVVPDGVKTIDERAFYNNLTITGVRLPDSVMQIKSFAFYACANLKEATLPSDLRTIGTSAFYECNLQSLTLPGSLTYVDSGAFGRNRALSSVTIPAALTRLENGAFADCSSLTAVTVDGENTAYSSVDGVMLSKDGTKLLLYPAGKSGASYTVPAGVTEIGEKAFYGAVNLESISLNRVTTLRSHAFASAQKLTGVNSASGLTTIGGYAFSDCTALTSFTVPSGVTTFQGGVFSGATALRTISVAYGNTKFKVVGNTLLTADGTTLLAYAEGAENTSYQMPDTVKTVKWGAFRNAPYLEYVTLSRALESVEGNCFDNCDALKTIVIPEGVKTLGDYMFYGCNALTCDVTIPSSVKYIGYAAFHRSPFTRVYWNAKAPRVNTSSFSWDVKDVYYIGSQEEWNAIPMKQSGKTIQDAFYGSPSVNYDYHPGLTIENNVVKSYSGAGGIVVIPEGVTSIAEKAFNGQSSVTEIAMPDTLKTIGNRAFNGTGITRMTFPASVESMGLYLFDGCESLRYIEVAEDNANFSSSSGILYNKDKTVLLRCPPAMNVGNVTVPDGVTKLDYSAFEDCVKVTGVILPNGLKVLASYSLRNTAMTTVTIPATVQDIQQRSFADNKKLTTVNLLAKAPSIYIYNNQPLAFLNCDALSTVNYAGTEEEWENADLSRRFPAGVTVNYRYDPDFRIVNGVLEEYRGKGGDVVIPDTVNSIRSMAFYAKSEVTSVTVPDSVSSIGEAAFYYCTGMKSVTLGRSVSRIYKQAFIGCSSLESVVVPDGVDEIGEGTFSGCTSLTSVTLPGTVKTIGRGAFSFCRKLTAIDIPGSVTAIGGSAFSTCTSLTEVTIPGSVTQLGKEAFYDCSSLRTVTIMGKVITVTSSGSPESDSLFESCTALTTINFAGTEAQWNVSGLGVDLPDGVTVVFNYGTLMITGQPESRYIVLGQPVTLSVEANCGKSYQWYFKKKGQSGFSVWNNRTHATETCTPNVSWDGIQLYCRVYDAEGNHVDSDAASVSVLSISQQPKSQTVTSGKPLTLSVKATGSGLKYQWYFKKTSQSAFSVWNGHTHATETCTPNDTWNGIRLYCRVTDGGGNKINSDEATVTLASALAITTQPTSKTVTLGESVTLSLKATGEGLTYQWYYKKKGASSFTLWSGRTHASETVTPNATWDGIQLYCIVKDGSGNTKQSNTITVTVKTVPVITTQPTNKTVNLGDSLTLSLKATGEGLTYQWYFRKKGQSDFSVWNGHTKATETCTPNATWDGIQLYCVVRNSAGNTTKSNTITVTVKIVPVITTQPTSKTVSLGDSLTLSLKATGEGLTYQWYFRKKGQSDFSAWNNRTHASETVTPNATWDGIQLYCVVRNSAGNTTKSNTITVTVKSGPVITTQPTNQTVTAGNSITLSLKASGTGLTYQWYFKKAGQTSFSVWNGRTHASETVSPNSTWNGIQLYCVVTDSAGKTAQSSTITVTVK